MQPVVPSTTDVTVSFFVYDATTFLPYNGLTAATAGLALAYRKGATGAETAITEADLSALTDAHSDGGLKFVRGAEYRLDLPDAAIPTAENMVTTWGGTATGYLIFGGAIVGRVVPLAPTTAGRTLDVSATGEAGVDWANVGSPTTTVGLSGTTVKTATDVATALATVDGIVDDILVDTGTTLPATLASIVTTLSGIAAAVWAYATRTLTQGAASVVAAVNGTNVTAYTDVTWSIALTGLGDMSARSKVWFIVYADAEAADTEATVLIDSVSGLTRLNGATYATAAHGALTFPSSTALTVTLNVAAAAQLSRGTYSYAIKMLDTGGDVTQLSHGGRLVIVQGAPQAIS